MYKIKKSKIIFCIIFVILFLISLVQRNTFNSANFIANVLYPQRTLTANEIFSVENCINALTLDDGVLTAVNNDPNVFIYNNKLNLGNNVKYVNLKVSGLNKTSPGEFYLFDDSDNILFENSQNYSNGNNIIAIENCDYAKMRFDVTNIKGTTFKIDSLTINPNDKTSANLSRALLPVINILILYLFFIIALTVYGLIRRYIAKNTGKIQNHCIFFAILALLTLIFYINPLGLSEKILAQTAINRVFTLNEFIANEQLKDFEVVDTNTIKSLNTDPWIAMDLEFYDLEYQDIKTIDIILSSLSKDENWAEIYHLLKVSKGMPYTTSINLTEGKNTLIFTHLFGDVNVIRLDLTTQKDVALGLEKVEINNPNSLFNTYKNHALNIIVLLLFIIASLCLYIFGKKLKKPDSLKNFNLAGVLYLALVFFSIFIAVLFSIPIMALVGLLIAMFLFGAFNKREITKNILTLPALATALIIAVFGIIFQSEDISFFTTAKQTQSVVACWIVLFGSIVSHLIICVSEGKNDNNGFNLFNLIAFVILLFAIAYYVVFAKYNYSDLSSDLWIYFTDYMWSYRFMLNNIILIFIIVYLMVLGGKRLTSVFLVVSSFIYIIGNFIKLNYQGTYLKFSDFLLISDLFRILPSYIGKVGVYAIYGIIIGAVIILLAKIKKIIKWFDFKYNAGIIPMSAVLIITIVANNMGSFRDLSSEQFKLYPPENYTDENMDRIVKNFSGEKYANDVKPDVILIMGESTIDVNKLKNITSNYNCVENIEKYKAADVISPRYGGGTAAVEMEALTGLTNYFFVPDMVAYNFYFSKGHSVNSLASEFNKNGYDTSAIHFNNGNFYNRRTVYEAMGFDNFYDISSFEISDKDIMNDGLTKDYLFFDEIKNKLENSENPQFIFGVTIEGHSPYTNKFDETEVKISSPLFNESDLNETQQYFQTVKDVDDELGMLIKYIEQREHPTLLYFWGDHLPPLDIYQKIGYFNGESFEKYSTPFVVYSNYKDIKIDTPQISPIQIACQILVDSGIRFSSYFDYIYSLRKQYPVLHKQLTADASGIDDYYSIVYDVLKGKGYLVNDDD